MQHMSTPSGQLHQRLSKLIFSVIKNVATTGAQQLRQGQSSTSATSTGALPSTSTLTTAASGAFGAAPDYQATNSDNDTSLQITNLPANLMTTGGMLYVTEIYTTHPLITPLDRFGIPVPDTLYSIAYF